MTRIELGISDLRATPGVAADPARWHELRRRMHRRVFLRSEGMHIDVGTPQLVSGQLLTRSAELVARANRFYAGVVTAYYQRPDLRAEFLCNPLLEPLLELEADDGVATPLSRFDAVLEPNGSIRIIELNSVGVCLIHMRGLLYLIRELARGGFADDARLVDQLARAMVDGFVRYARSRQPDLPHRIVVGSVTPSGWLRAGQLLMRAAFERAGCDYVSGGPEHLAISDRDICVRGTRVHVLWADFLLYLAYQYARYKHIPFPNKVPHGREPEQAAELLADRRFLQHLRTGRVVLISPARSYLALSKSLLSWIHRDDRPVDPEVRAFLANRVARTYSARDRADGLISRDHVAEHRGAYLVKPCLYGASFGVQLGEMTEPAAWRAKLAEIWDDPSWTVQVFHTPIKTVDGEWVSLGLANYGGTLGGVFLRTSGSLLINARDSGFIPAVLDTTS